MIEFTSSDLKYIGEPSPHLICPICLSPFLVPVTAQVCSHTYCRSCITEALAHTQRCPVDRTPLAVSELTRTNPIIQSLVNELLVECPYHEAGCPMSKLRRDALNTHLEDDCMHTPTKCVIPDCDTTLPLVDMFEHQEMHRMQFELEWAPEPSSSSAPQAQPLVRLQPQRREDDWVEINDDDGYASDDAHSPTTRPQGLRRLYRNWAALSRLSGPPSRRPSPRESPPANARPLPPLPQAEPGQFPFLVRAINDYEPTDDGELFIRRDDILRITGVRHDGWYEGYHIDSEDTGWTTSGLIPRMFVEVFPRDSNASLTASPEPYVPREELESAAPRVTPQGRRTGRISPLHVHWDENSEDRHRPGYTSLTQSTLSSMYTDTDMDLNPSESDFRSRSPDRPSVRLTPQRRRRSTDQPSRRPSEILYYVKALSSHRATQHDDFDFQEGDVMAVTAMAGRVMRGYLLDDDRRRDNQGRNRIPAELVEGLY